ncbi:MAG: nucleotidyltransferase family protein, partial [Anaerolineae bacterium]|nr:nucleotidyltransferase family protein [Anaerolineae bacterium]
ETATGVRQRLEEIALRTRVSNTLHCLGLEEWLERFDAAGIPIVILKGVALTALVYGRASLRRMQDVDILVRRADFQRAEELLRAAGFLRYRDLSGALGPTLRTQSHWIKTTPASALDLHWHLVDSGYYAYRVPIEWFWEHTIKVPFWGREIRVFTPEAQLLHLAAHLELHHAGDGWLSLYDIAALVHKFGDKLDWELVLDAAIRFEWNGSLYRTLQHAHDAFGVSIPSPVRERLARLPTSWHERLARVLATPAAHPAAFVFDGWWQPGVRGKVRYWWRSLFPAAEFMQTHGTIRTRRELIWQYLLRLGRGLWRIPRALWAAVLRSGVFRSIEGNINSV